MEKNKILSQVICKISYSLAKNVSSIVVNQLNDSVSVGFNPGCGWIEIYHTNGIASFNETENRSNAGLIFEQELNFTFPGFDKLNRKIFQLLANSKLIFKIDYDSYSIIYGSKENPCLLSYNFQSDKSGYVVKVNRSGDRCFMI